MWSIQRGLTTNRSVPAALIIADNCKSFVSQKQKADSFVRLYRDVSNLKFQKQRGMKKVLNSRLRSEVVDPEVCHGFTTDEVKAALCDINLIEVAGSDKILPRFLHHFGWSLSPCCRVSSANRGR